MPAPFVLLQRRELKCLFLKPPSGRTAFTHQGELMVSRALYPGALHHQSLSGEDAEWCDERLHDAIREAATTFPAPGPGEPSTPRTLPSPTRQRKPRQKKLHDTVKKRGMTGAELAEKAAKKQATAKTRPGAPPKNSGGQTDTAAESRSQGQRRSGRGPLVSIKHPSDGAVGNGGGGGRRATTEMIIWMDYYVQYLTFYTLFQTLNSMFQSQIFGAERGQDVRTLSRESARQSDFGLCRDIPHLGRARLASLTQTQKPRVRLEPAA
ncbi:hypothetical protein FN846DRAFT_984290 [Sphaerosporella brunnea]|uniref:Uncharacterized protein n=1 Tax=Sphaerosporella brunnea TaxID=1250544 RepID=A0A5J5EW41_9PEZI|nr:hypothetical protein FN846DRAFT_984290 [Sphaerosporella brunnea]